MRSFSKLVRFAVVIGAGLGVGPATHPVQSLDDVEASFANRIQTIDQEYRNKYAVAENDQLKGLKQLLDRAMESKDLDEAVRLREKIRSAQATVDGVIAVPNPDAAAADMAKLENTLRNTTWEWGQDESIKFQADGTVGNEGWNSRGLVTNWKAIDRRTVLLYIQRGRSDDRYAILTFVPNLESFSGFGFDGTGTPLPHNRQIKK